MADDYVLGLDVSMDNLLAIKVFEGAKNLRYRLARIINRQFFRFSYFSVKIAFLHELQN
jgi:hypothetical protein